MTVVLYLVLAFGKEKKAILHSINLSKMNQVSIKTSVPKPVTLFPLTSDRISDITSRNNVLEYTEGGESVKQFKELNVLPGK